RSIGARLCRGRAYARQAYDLLMAGGDPLAVLARAEQDVDQALRLDKRPGAYSLRGTVRTYRALFRARKGQDPASELAAAEEDLGVPVAAFPGFVDPLIKRGLLHVEWGLHLRRTKSDRAAAELAAGAADLDRALAIEPDNVEAIAVRARRF